MWEFAVETLVNEWTNGAQNLQNAALSENSLFKYMLPLKGFSVQTHF